MDNSNATVQKYAEDLKMDGDGIFRSMGTVVGRIKEGVFYCCDDFQKQVFTKYMEIQRSHDKGDIKEKQFRDALAQALEQDGWKVSKEVYTSCGRIDILADKDSHQMIIETKISSLANACSHALGQLLFYQNYYPGASLWLATPQRPEETVLSILSKNGVNYYA